MTVNIHATGLVLEGTGLLVRGPSGAGKSLLALALLDAWDARGRSARLVADDRVEIDRSLSGLTMRVPQRTAGLIELRGRGIVCRPFVAQAEVHLVVDLTETLERMPEEEDLLTDLLGLPVPRCPVPRSGCIDLGHQLLLVSEGLRSLRIPKNRQGDVPGKKALESVGANGKTLLRTAGGGPAGSNR